MYIYLVIYTVSEDNMRGLDLIRWEMALTPGDIVSARFTNCGHYYQFRAEIVRVNAKSVNVRPVGGSVYPTDPPGRTFNIKRMMATGHSVNNGVFPLGGVE